MLRTFGFLAVFSGAAFAAPSKLQDLPRFLEKTARGESAVLSKAGSSSVLTATTYSSANYNVTFTCPAGWSITAIDSVADRVLLNVAKSGRNSVLVYVTKHATADEAFLWDSYAAWLGVRTAYGASTVTPYVLAASDTTSSPYHLSYAQLEYQISTGTRIYDIISASKGVYSQFVAYSAGSTDYDANYADYDAIWEGIGFLDDAVTVDPGVGGGVLPKGGTGVTLQGNLVLNPRGLKLEFRDSKGRNRLTTSQKRVELDKAEKLFLKVR